MVDAQGWWRRVLLAALAIPAIEIGLWATFTPRSFYDDFPGASRHWVAVDGPYNEHLVRDVGGLYLGLAVVLVWAIVTLRPSVVRAAAWAAFVSGLPHFVYHVRHLDLLSQSNKVGETVLLGLGLVVPIVVLLIQRSVHPGAAPLEHASQGGRAVGHDPVDTEVQ
jgi:hypothetical protein